MAIFCFSKDTLRCPKCGGYYDKRDGFTICIKCGVELIPEKEFNGLPVYASNKTQVKCPYCNSLNVKKIKTLNRMMSTGLFGLGSSKIGKQWHCNDCESDF